MPLRQACWLYFDSQAIGWRHCRNMIYEYESQRRGADDLGGSALPVFEASERPVAWTRLVPFVAVAELSDNFTAKTTVGQGFDWVAHLNPSGRPPIGIDDDNAEAGYFGQVRGRADAAGGDRGLTNHLVDP
jgi:hypothetical protein